MRKGSGMVFGAVVVASCALAFFTAERAPLRAQAGTTDKGAVGIFTQSGDVGTVLHRGYTNFDSEAHSYTLTASGENIWANADAFQFAWKKMSGDVSLSANVQFVDKGMNPHRKAVLMLAGKRWTRILRTWTQHCTAADCSLCNTAR